MIAPTDHPTPPLRTWRPMAAWTAGILLALGLAWFVGAVVVPVWQVRSATAGLRADVPREELQNLVATLGGPQAAARKVAFYLRLPERLAPPETKTGAVLLLACCGIWGVESLVAQLRCPDAERRAWAARVLAVSGGQRAVEPLMAALSDPEEDVRSAAALSLGRLGDARAVEPLLQALASAKGHVRQRVRREFPYREIENAWYTFEREACVRALGEIGASRAVPDLEKALQDEDSGVRSAAAEALKKIRGEESGK